MGIGADDVFMFTDTWEQSKPFSYNRDGTVSLARRLSWVIRHAGFGMFLTSFSTAAAFYGNAVSKIPPIRQFGCLMGTLVRKARAGMR
jgi:hypothetical protein